MEAHTLFTWVHLRVTQENEVGERAKNLYNPHNKPQENNFIFNFTSSALMHRA